ncbi:MAG: response regulator [Pyrinomonadaceae bacterium]
MKVLIVDDSPEMRSILSHFVRPICQDIYECSDGIYALECYQKYEPDWVLMDWQMKEMNGITASEQILEKYPNAHICMVSSFDDIDLKEEAIKVGVTDFVRKDDLSGLRQILKRK